MSLSNPTDAELAIKYGKVLDLRKHGVPFDAIAKALGYSGKGAAYNAYNAAIKSVRTEPSKEALQLELERLDMYLYNLRNKINAGDEKAINTALKIGERRAKLLGLDDFERRMAEVAERKVIVDEAQALMMAKMLSDTLNQLELPEDKKAQAVEIIAAQLDQLDAEQA